MLISELVPFICSQKVPTDHGIHGWKCTLGIGAGHMWLELNVIFALIAVSTYKAGELTTVFEL